jgi:hypothetical protein
VIWVAVASGEVWSIPASDKRIVANHDFAVEYDVELNDVRSVELAADERTSQSLDSPITILSPNALVGAEGGASVKLDLGYLYLFTEEYNEELTGEIPGKVKYAKSNGKEESIYLSDVFLKKAPNVTTLPGSPKAVTSANSTLIDVGATADEVANAVFLYLTDVALAQGDYDLTLLDNVAVASPPAQPRGAEQVSSYKDVEVRSFTSSGTASADTIVVAKYYESDSVLNVDATGSLWVQPPSVNAASIAIFGILLGLLITRLK